MFCFFGQQTLRILVYFGYLEKKLLLLVLLNELKRSFVRYLQLNQLSIQLYALIWSNYLQQPQSIYKEHEVAMYVRELEYLAIPCMFQP